MDIVELPISSVVAAGSNANEMDTSMRAHLQQCIRRFGFVVPLVVRMIGDNQYETIGGAQRLEVLKGLGAVDVPCVLVEADDAEAKLLSQALNHIAGEDNPGLRSEVIRDLLEAMPQAELLSILPDSADELRALASLGEMDLAEHLQAWEKAQAARLRHVQLQLTDAQLEVVEEALQLAIAGPTQDVNSPNRRGIAFTAICQHYPAIQEGGGNDGRL